MRINVNKVEERFLGRRLLRCAIVSISSRYQPISLANIFEMWLNPYFVSLTSDACAAFR